MRRLLWPTLRMIWHAFFGLNKMCGIAAKLRAAVTTTLS